MVIDPSGHRAPVRVSLLNKGEVAQDGSPTGTFRLELGPQAAMVARERRGLRIFVKAQTADDWTNHEAGVECYAGHAPRFLTLTGQRLPERVHAAQAGTIRLSRSMEHQ